MVGIGCEMPLTAKILDESHWCKGFLPGAIPGKALADMSLHFTNRTKTGNIA
jgi:hypothetical protein